MPGKRDCRESVLAFTLVELLVVMAIVALLVGLILPALSRAQQIANSSKCKANLRQIGQGLAVYASYFDGYLCSGSSSPKYEQANMTRVGWIADLVNFGYGNVFNLGCPANETDFSEVLVEMLTSDDGRWVDAAPQAENAADIAKLIRLGYMTNYTATWYLTRTGMLPNAWESFINSAEVTPKDGMRVDVPTNCYGPLRNEILNRSEVVTNRVPLMACGALAELSEGTLPFDCPPFKRGQVGTEATSDGPVKFRHGDDHYAGEGFQDVIVGYAEERDADDKVVQVGQDLRDFGPTHGSANSHWCNVLFADTHVLAVADRNNDGYIGFTGNSEQTGDLRELDRMFVGSIVSKRRSGVLR